ncbi:hypothetical protein ACFVYF_26985 [Streptomyces sp. NPDC058274]|jgi:hypothetical protein|uniref:hypothetical protein n=1 Tax=Streptomyces sp. NPDC058274 TaxID=3346416 RepID=UPI0029D1318C|nr:hypothetical protein [Streptomyces sp.]
MITLVSHPAADDGPAGLTLALAVARELHPPTARAPEVAVAVPELMGLRTSAARPHHRKVPLSRLGSLRG